MRVAAEHQFHTSEQIEGYVTEALRICSEHGLEPPDRSRLLPKLVELLAARQVWFEQPQPVPMDLNGLLTGKGKPF